MFVLRIKQDCRDTRLVLDEKVVAVGNTEILELITFEILAAERLRLMGFDNRLSIDCFTNVVNILVWLFSTIDRFRSEKCESNYIT